MGLVGLLLVWLVTAVVCGILMAWMFPLAQNHFLAGFVLNWRNLPGIILGFFLGIQSFRASVRFNQSERTPASGPDGDDGLGPEDAILLSPSNSDEKTYTADAVPTAVARSPMRPPIPRTSEWLDDDEAPARSKSRRSTRRTLDDDDFEDRPSKRHKRHKSRWGWILAAVLGGITVIVAALVAVFWGSAASLDDAKQTAEDYYRAVRQKNWDGAMSFYAPEFFGKTPKGQWRQALPRLVEKLGDYRNHTLVGWRYFAGAGGSQIVLNYQVQYAKGPATETLSFLGTGQGKPMLIFGHQINSPALLLP